MNDTSDINQNSTINHCRICNASIPQNEKLCENCKSVYATSKSSKDNNTSTTINNQNNSYNEDNQNTNNSINNNTIVCNSCGSIINKNQAFCNYCGASNSNINHNNSNNLNNLSNNSSINNNYNNYNNGYNSPNQNPNPYNKNGNNQYGNYNNQVLKKSIKNSIFIKKFMNSLRVHKSLYIGITISIIIVIFAIVLISSLNSYEHAIRTHFDVMFLGKTENILDIVPEEYIETYYKDEDEFIDNMETNSSNMYEYNINEYGDNLKYSFEITKEKALSNSKYDDLCDYLKSNFDIRKKEIGKAYSIKLDCTIEGDDDFSEYYDQEMIVIKIHGKWYLMHYDSYMNSWYFL